ncbi:MAG: RNA polymerase factor sigma-54 [Candidatus Margulisiibacteriota bacterium]
MDLRFEQSLKQSIQLMLSPKMLAMLKMLSLPYIEMVSEIQRQADENPMIEVESPDMLAEYLNYLDSHKKDKKEIDYSEYPGLENLKYGSENLHDHLLEQLQYEEMDDDQTAIAEKLIDSIDSRGYLKDFEAVSQKIVSELGAGQGEIDEVLRIIQTLDPDGVGARDLKECLLIQIREYNFDSDDLRTILGKVVNDHLEDLANENFSKIAIALDIGEDGAREIGAYIKNNLNPNPGSLYGGEISHIIPSFVIKKDPKREKYYYINLEEQYGPKIIISRRYQQMLKDPNTDEETVKFLKEKMDKGRELLENLAKRKETAEEIMKIVVETQEDFLEKGSSWIKPLQQKNIADRLGLHPSTVSRAIAEKYVQTPQGLLPIKALCPREVKGYSAQLIKKHMAEIISKEKRSNPLSDEDISRALKETGIEIDRRTVASYRKDLGIASSSERGGGE